MVKFSPKKQKQLFFNHRKAKQDRNAKRPGAKISIKVGDWVRVALETKAKGETMKKKGPKQKYSSKSYQVEKISKNNMYKLDGLPHRRFP